MDIKQVPAHPNNYAAIETKKVGIVFHWMAGEIAACDATFKNPTKKASAHYGVGSNGEVHQYVQDKYIAWHANNSEANRKYFGIEHAGGQNLSNGTRKHPTPECHEASIELCVYLCKLHNIKSLEYDVNAFRHNDVSNEPTACSGTLDVDYIISETNKKMGSNSMTFNDWFEGAKWWNDAISDKNYLPDSSKITNKDYNDMTQDEKEELVKFYRMSIYLNKTSYDD